MLARNEEKTKQAIEDIKKAVPDSTGQMVFIRLDLADLTTIRASAEQFLQMENQLHLLFNNAGLAFAKSGLKSEQGYEIQLGVNCLGSFALTNLLTPTIVSTAKTAPTNSVRVIWVSSNAAELSSPDNFLDSVKNVENLDWVSRYCVSKLGNYLHAAEFANRHRADGIMSVPLNPGALDSELWRDWSSLTVQFMRATVLHPVIYGAYTCMFAAFSPEISRETSGTQGKFYIPGRYGT
ncbi:hypothetical protein F5Y16DRAFT_370888 [Xylariaceae sp. FL0255]|nr:hypothetical protein F5Y16DRAFT_370888 [Xylariaceae sp. FL0255]